MLKWAKLGGLYIGAGALIGLGTVGWMYAHRLDHADVSARPGTGPVLVAAPAGIPATANGTATSTAPDTSGNAHDSTIISGQTAVLGAMSTPSASPARESSLPQPSEFDSYNRYKDNATALYADISQGSGAAVAAGSKVTVQYRGWLTTGQEFDESYARGEAYSFVEGAQGVIPGWEEGLFGMKAGGKRRLIIPPAKGYGDKAQGSIPANSVLIFDVELLSVQ